LIIWSLLVVVAAVKLQVSHVLAAVVVLVVINTSLEHLFLFKDTRSQLALVVPAHLADQILLLLELPQLAVAEAAKTMGLLEQMAAPVAVAILTAHRQAQG
jgi:hypothetical protein